MKVIYPSTCRRKLQQQNSHKIRQRLCTAFLSFLFLLTCFVSVNASQVAVDPSDEIVNSFSFHASGFRIGIVNNPLENLNVYNLDSTAPYYFTRYATDFNITRASYRCYVDYIIDSDITSYSHEKYVLIESTLAYGTDLLNNGLSYYYFYDIDGNIIQSMVPADREIEIITLEFQGEELRFYKNYLIYQVEDLSSWVSEIYRISFNQYFDSMGDVSVPFLFTDLSLKFYNNFESALGDIGNSLKVMQNQNSIIINNLNDVKNKLDNIHNSFTTDNPPGVSGTDEVIENTESIENILNDGVGDFIEKPVVEDIQNNLDLILTLPRISAAFIFWGDMLDACVDSVFPLQLVLTVAAGLIIVSSLFALFRGPLSGERDADRLSQEARERINLTSVERQNLRDQNNRYRGG